MEEKNSPEGLLVEFRLKDGSEYEGEWQDGYRMHGRGKWTFPDGRYYDGEWAQGVRCGYGVYVFPGGEKYEGEWKDDIRHGMGKYTFASGQIWEGEWVDDKFVGQGTEEQPIIRPPTMEDYKARAEAGDAHAAYAVAALSMREKEFDAVFKYANLSVDLSDGKNHEALNILGLCYRFGEGCEKDLKKSFEYYKLASELGNDEAQFSLGLFYLEGDVAEKDIDKAIYWFEKSAAAGNETVQHYLPYAKAAKEGIENGSIDEIRVVRP